MEGGVAMRFLLFHFREGGGAYLEYKTSDEAARNYALCRDNSELARQVANSISGRNYHVTVKLLELADCAPDRSWILNK